MTSGPDISTPKAKSPLRFLLIRHGESEANVNRAQMRGLRVPDESIQLTPLGFNQAEACGQFLHDYLRDNPVEGGMTLYSSSYDRARQTAQRIYDNIKAVTGSTPLRAHESDFLVEQHYGLADSLTDEERGLHYPDFQEREDVHYQFGSRQFSPLPGGETRMAVEHRGTTFLDSVFRERDDHGARTFIIVSYGTTTRLIAKKLLKMPREAADQDPNPSNCGVRLLQRYGDNYEKFSDFGYIWQNGQPLEPKIVSHPSVADKFAEGAYRNYRPRPVKETLTPK